MQFLSRTKRIGENVFGILYIVLDYGKNHCFLLSESEKAEIIVTECIYLHDFLKKNQYSKLIYTANETFDVERKKWTISGRNQSGESISLPHYLKCFENAQQVQKKFKKCL